MKKTTLAAFILAAAISLTACDALGISFNNKNNSSNSENSETASDRSEPENSEIPESTPSGSTSGTASKPEGGNPDTAKSIEITISEDKYFYDNHEISFDELIELLDGLDENTSAKLNDENATLKAYETLTNALNERNIPFESAN